MTSFDIDRLVMSNISGPIYTNPDTFETAYFFYMNRLSDHSKPVNPLTKTAYFWNRSPEWIFLGVRLVFLKPDIFEANYVINSGPVLNENFQVQNGGQQFCGRQQLPISN